MQSLAPSWDSLRGAIKRVGRRRGQGRRTGEPAPGGAEAGRSDDGDRDFAWFAENLPKLSPSKQLRVMETWPGVELKTPEGLTVFARTKKERLRFIREISEEMHAWMSAFADGDVFYDIGANCGSLTLAVAAMHGGRVAVVAIEPGYGSFESLVRNLSHAGLLRSVIPLQVALADTTGIQPINYYKSTEAGTSLHAVGAAIDHEGKPFEPVEVQMVPTFTLDDLIEMLRLSAPTRVKIDVDGFEEQVLQGATRTLESGSIRELAIEIVDHDRAGTRPAAVCALLAERGYELSAVFRHHGETSFVADYLFSRRENDGER